MSYVEIASFLAMTVFFKAFLSEQLFVKNS
jgi:hypothetical protein